MIADSTDTLKVSAISNKLANDLLAKLEKSIRNLSKTLPTMTEADSEVFVF